MFDIKRSDKSGKVCYNSYVTLRCSSMGRAPAFQAGYEGSILTRSKRTNTFPHLWELAVNPEKSGLFLCSFIRTRPYFTTLLATLLPHKDFLPQNLFHEKARDYAGCLSLCVLYFVRCFGNAFPLLFGDVCVNL